MDTSIPTHTPSAPAEPTFSQRLRTSKALLPTAAVLGVTTLALAAALLVQRSEALSGVPEEEVPVALTAPANAPITTTPRSTVQRLSNPIAQQPVRPVMCATCGTVESVTTVQRAAPTSGLGAVAGGVVGGLLGNQVGGGSGRTAATVLGAVGGGYAGNAIEKKTRTVTAYQVRVRMQDGSVRSFEQGASMAIGAPVVVEGNTLRPA